MSFSFNFPDPSFTDASEDVVPVPPDENVDINSPASILQPFREWFSNDVSLDVSIPRHTYKLLGTTCIECLDSAEVERKLTEEAGAVCGVTEAFKQHSDLVPYVYEGGLKVWECAIDLSEYLCGVDMTDKIVLELGCGAGLAGIVAMLKGATEVHFQDYNPEVVEHYTIPNVLLNRPSKCTCTCRYFSGDWDNFRQHLNQQRKRYDYICTAETIYKPENYRKLVHIFSDFLKQTGTVFVAAKSNYFGVGGGTRDFEHYIQHDSHFSVKICHVIETGIPREILELKWK